MRDAKLFDEHIPRLRRYARALTGERTQADDLVQECLARAWEKRSLWQLGTDLRAWLFTIMHNLFVNDLRRRKSRPELLALDDEALDAPRRATQEDGLGLRDLQAALDRLPMEQREVLLLVGLEEMSYAEVAKTLGIPLGTVMSRLSRARERLRVQLHGAGPALRRVK
jgi:RNA polymerase sigma-70 factor (ECF subfamily)